MLSELKDLYISSTEIERLSGLEISDRIIGGLLWGTYRWPISSPQQILTLVMTELLMMGLSLMMAVPLGVALSRNVASEDCVLWGIVAIALFLYTLRQIRMIYLARRMRSLMHLLDEVDCYHQVLEAVDLLDQLSTVERPDVQVATQIVVALNQTRESLVAALITEKILRNSRSLLSRREALIARIEENLLTLRSLELQHQAQDYSTILDQALNIAIRVQDEVHHLR